MSTDIAHPAIVFFAILGAGAVILIGLYVLPCQKTCKRLRRWRVLPFTDLYPLSGHSAPSLTSTTVLPYRIMSLRR